MNSKPNLLITGVSGLLGGNLAQYFLERYRIVGVYHNNKPLLPGVELIQKDLSVKEDFDFGGLESFSPDYVIHCAGEADVDTCEQNAAHADRYIFQMTASVSQFAKRHGAHLVCISTDAVSDGTKEYLREDDALNPINYYGKTKVRTERYLLSEHRSSMVVRTRFYGVNVTGKQSFTEYLIREFEKGREVVCFTDNYCSQIYAMNLACILEESMKKRLFGIFNIVEDRKHSRFGYAQMVARTFGFDESLVVPDTMYSARSIAPRPQDTSLSNEKIKASIESEILPIEKGLATMRKDMRRWR